jgi:excinuclease ABC subunit C
MIKDKLKLLPLKPGCYLMKNSDNNIIYVGKAKQLKNRVSSYFRGQHFGKTAKMISEIKDFEYIVVDSETESLILENNLIKKYSPKYNILLRDDKSYPYIEFNTSEVPKLTVIRNVNRKNKKNITLYGTFPNVMAARKIVDMLNRIYPLRKCTTYQKKPCLYYHIGQCLGYCTKSINQAKVEEMKKEIKAFFNGEHNFLTKRIEEEMTNYSNLMNYEKAKELKELLDYIKIVLIKQKVEIDSNKSIDVFGMYADNEYLSISILFIRGGKISGKHSFIMPLIDEKDEALISYISSFYDKGILKPKEIFIPIKNDILENYLELKVYNPQKGLKKHLVDMASENAKIALKEKIEIIKKEEIRTNASNDELKEILKLKTLNRIEIFDNSNLFGNFNVSGMVVFKNGLPSKNDYRKFKITLDKNDDYGTMKEVIYRRYFRVLKDNLEKPDLIIVDGGLGQMHIARDVLNSLNLNIPIIGLKKDDKHQTSALLAFEPIIEIAIDKKSALFHYLERMQDEVHNFTINYHKNLRSKGALTSIFDNIEGIGLKRRNALLKKFGNIANIKKASIVELTEIIPKEIALKLLESLRKTK